MRLQALLMSVSLCTPALLAQGGIVSPLALTNRPGSYESNWPFENTGRWQQVHGDLRGTPRSVTGLAFRRVSYAQPVSQAVARTLDAEVAIGEGDFLAFGSRFAGNYTGPRVVAFARKAWNLPSWVLGQGSPAPFTAGVMFDAPFAFSGQRDLVWEITVHGSTQPGSYYPADWHSEQNWLPGTTQYEGAGCRATNQGPPMLLLASFATLTDPPRVQLGMRCYNLPLPNASFNAFLLGTSDPNLALPGLCANLRTNALVSIPVAPNPPGEAAWGTVLPGQSSWLGATLYVQCVASDPAQSPYPYVLSPGAAPTAPGAYPDPIRVHQAVSYYKSTADTGFTGTYQGLVVLFRG